MGDPIRVLLVEDSKSDALLVLRELRHGGVEAVHERVDTPEAMQAALETNTWDAIICDYSLPQFGGPEALELMHALDLDLPFIIVSGKVGEETAVAMLKAGAHDFISKDNLTRLVPAIRREIGDAEVRRGARLAHAILKESEARFHTLARVSPVGIFQTDAGGKYLYVNDQWTVISGLSPEKSAGDGWLSAIHPEDRGRVEAQWRRCVAEKIPFMLEYRFRRPNGTITWVLARAEPAADDSGGIGNFVGTVTDITELKQAQLAVEYSEQRFRSLIENASDLVMLLDSAGVITYVSPSIERIGGYETAEIRGKSFVDLVHPDDALAAARDFADVLQEYRAPKVSEARYRDKGGGWISVEAIAHNLLEDPAVHGIVINGRDVTERKRAEQALANLNRALKTLSSCNGALIHATEELGLLRESCRITVEVGGYRMAWVGFAEQDAGKTVRPVAHVGCEELDVERAGVTWADSELGRGPVGAAIRTQSPQVIQDANTDPLYAPWRDHAIDLGYGSVLALPLVSQGQNLGALSIYSAQSNAFEAEEIALLTELADDLAFGIVTLRTRAAHQAGAAGLQRSMEATIQAVAATIERRDPYTAGHQRRVAELAEAIARELGLPEGDIHGIHLAGVIHDLGKIQVPAEILAKPGRLSEVEYKLIKVHPQAGFDILKGVDFPWPIAQIIVQHHERLDGSGYPRGLADGEIVNGARIVAVADTIEAMSSHRPYRPALGLDAALEEIKKMRGKQYDPAVVDACVTLFEQERFAFSN